MLATTGTRGSPISAAARSGSRASRAGRISGEWKGAETGSSLAMRAPRSLARATARSTAARSSGDHRLLRRIQIGDGAGFIACGVPGHAGDGVGVDPHQRRHGADADRHRLLHQFAALSHQA